MWTLCQEAPISAKSRQRVATFPGVGARIGKLSIAKGLNNTTLADVADVSRQTVTNATERDTISRNTAAKLAAKLGVTEEQLLGEEPLVMAVSEPRPRGVPLGVRVWLKQFELELAKAGATEEEIGDARALLTREEAFVFYVGGRKRDATEEETIVGMEALARFVRDRLRDVRGLRFDGH